MSIIPNADIQTHEQNPLDDGNCFACGPQSEHGLRLVFRYDPAESQGVLCVTTLGDRFQGWVGFAHGGVVCMLLDEAMAHAAARAGQCCVTANMNVRFRRPVTLAEPITIRGILIEARGRVHRLQADIRDAQGRMLAQAQGDFMSRGPIDPMALFSRESVA